MSYTMRQAAAIIDHAISNPLSKGYRVIYLEGSPGMGKTAMAYDLYSNHKRSPGNPHGFTSFLPYVAPEREPTDWGLPMVNAERTAISMLPLDEFKFKEGDRPFILFDEIDKANNMMQNVLARCMHEQRVGNIVFPNGTFMLAAGNKMTDRAGSVTANSHIKNRRTMVPVHADTKEWIEDVGIPFGLHPSVISFLRTTDLLHKFDSSAPSFPSPRSWTKVGEELNRTMDQTVERALIEGDIGVEASNSFWGHLKIFRNLRSPEAIIANPSKIALPTGKDSTAVMWAEITSLAKYTDRSNADAIFTYFNRLPQEFAFCGYRDVMIREPKHLTSSKAGQMWMVANATTLQATRA